MVDLVLKDQKNNVTRFSYNLNFCVHISIDF